MTLHWNQTRAEWAVAILLAMIAGYLDGYGLLFLGTYVSLMSENTTRSGQGDFHAAFSSAVAILFFETGSFLGNLFSQSRLRHSYPGDSHLTRAMIEASVWEEDLRGVEECPM